MLLGTLLMHGVSVAIAESLADVRWTSERLVALLYLAVGASAIEFLIYFDLLTRLGPIEINLVSYATPITAALTGLVFLGEVPTIHTAVGFACILVGFVLIKRTRSGPNSFVVDCTWIKHCCMSLTAARSLHGFISTLRKYCRDGRMPLDRKYIGARALNPDRRSYIIPGRGAVTRLNRTCRSELNAFITAAANRARERAHESEAEVESGDIRSPLSGPKAAALRSMSPKPRVNHFPN